MDAMPIGNPHLEGEPVKVGDVAEPGIESKHVERVKPSRTDSHKHLPGGVSETEEEKQSRWFIGSIDCGTTSSRFLIFDGEGNPVASHQIEFENMYPESG
jgi:glycerol kinase